MIDQRSKHEDDPRRARRWRSTIGHAAMVAALDHISDRQDASGPKAVGEGADERAEQHARHELDDADQR